MSTAPTLCRSCGRDTATTEDWRCDYCGQPKPLTAEPEQPPSPSRAAPGVWADLRPQLAAAGLAAAIAVVGFATASELLLLAAAAVLVVAVVTKIVRDGW